MSQEFPRWVYIEQATGPRSTKGSLWNLREVAPGLYVGGMVGVMARDDWSLVIDFDGASKQDGNESFYPPGTLHCLRFPDGRPFPPLYLDRTLELFDQARAQEPERPVLFHCAAGMSRSPSAAYAILRVRYGVDHGEALLRVRLDGDASYPMPRTLDGAVAWAEEQLHKGAGGPS